MKSTLFGIFNISLFQKMWGIGLLFYLFYSFSCNAQKIDLGKNFTIFSKEKSATILYPKDSKFDSLISNLLAADISKVTNIKPRIETNIEKVKGNVIVIGSVNSDLIKKFIQNNLRKDFDKKWECYLYKTQKNPFKNITKAFIIAGSDARGTAYGVFNISRKIGVSPWYWWADVAVEKSRNLVINQPDFYSEEPSVKYRGIFLNDEDWGLQPWSANTFEPEVGDIGPKTYSKIFELLLRLNANTIWPAMHRSTKAFFHYPKNVKTAELYKIVVGSSHAEPMLRNNVYEWDKKRFGDFNYKTNSLEVYKYWEKRVKESKNINAIYTMGMRGIHDSGMEGVSSKEDAVKILTKVIHDQRNLLKKYINDSIVKVPQAFTVYKEVLDLYKNGLDVPDDITLVWTDDNYGYIRALSNTEEQKRPGGSGVYYHASYWGRPHDYLWLNSSNPNLIREEMMKAYSLKSKNIWILNVGDIKPIEYSIQLFMDMAYNAALFQNPVSVLKHQKSFFTDIFGEALGEQISEVQNSYFQLAYERRPEFMAWSQTEPITPIQNTAYSPINNGDEIQNRINNFEKIQKRVEKIKEEIPERYQSSFFQLVDYPINAAANINKKFLYRDRALCYAQQGRRSAVTYKNLSHETYANIVDLTKKYNNLSDGKWKGMMDMKPRNLPVFDDPEINLIFKKSKQPIGIDVENNIHSNGDFIILTFYKGSTDTKFIDIYLKNSVEGNWEFQQLPKWIKANKKWGRLNSANLEQRIEVGINWDMWLNSGKPKYARFALGFGSLTYNFQINISDSYKNVPENAFIEKNNFIVGYATDYSEKRSFKNQKWKKINGLGHSGAVMEASPISSSSIENPENAPVLEFNLVTETKKDSASLYLIVLPTHPLTINGKVRIGVQWNDDPVKIIDFKTEGRSAEWKENVLRNKAIKKIQVSLTAKGKQELKVYMLDPGVLLDYWVLITKNNYQLPYSILDETVK